jgi:hypothetical protein
MALPRFNNMAWGNIPEDEGAAVARQAAAQELLRKRGLNVVIAEGKRKTALERELVQRMYERTMRQVYELEDDIKDAEDDLREAEAEGKEVQVAKLKIRLSILEKSLENEQRNAERRIELAKETITSFLAKFIEYEKQAAAAPSRDTIENPMEGQFGKGRDGHMYRWTRRPLIQTDSRGRNYETRRPRWTKVDRKTFYVLDLDEYLNLMRDMNLTADDIKMLGGSRRRSTRRNTRKNRKTRRS